MDRLTVRDVEPGELAELAALCGEHAEFDRRLGEPVQPLPADLPERLRQQIFGAAPSLWCLVADVGGALAGYASYTWHASTWRGDSYVLLDCLFVRNGYRGLAIGRKLFDTGAVRARESGATRVQWQTPVDNVDGQRFYARTGAHAVTKLRYTLTL